MNRLITKIKEKILNLGISTIIFIVIGLVGLIICSYVYEWKIFKHLTSPQAFLIYVIAIMSLIWVLTEIWFKKLKGDSDDED